MNKKHETPTDRMLREITRIAAEELDIPTLKARNSDDLDFHTVSVWFLRKALLEAYLAGERAANESKGEHHE